MRLGVVFPQVETGGDVGAIDARAAPDEWLAWASRSKLAPFVKLARTIRRYRDSIEATIDST